MKFEGQTDKVCCLLVNIMAHLAAEETDIFSEGLVDTKSDVKGE